MTFKRVRSLPHFEPSSTQRGEEEEEEGQGVGKVPMSGMEIDGGLGGGGVWGGSRLGSAANNNNHHNNNRRWQGQGQGQGQAQGRFGTNKGPAVCVYWLQGRCNRNPCNFLHTRETGPETGPASSSGRHSGGVHKRLNASFDDKDASSPGWGRPRNQRGGGAAGAAVGKPRGKNHDKPCVFFLRGSCNRGENCNFLHSHTSSADVSFVTQLVGHDKAVRAIALPSGSDKLYTGSQDGTIRVWDCDSGQCANVISVGGDVGCMLAESGWLFVGLQNEVKAWNLQNNTEQNLIGPKGQVYALAIFSDMLLAGAQDGCILAWKFSSNDNLFMPAMSFLGHSGAVITMEVVGERLYSGSMDNSIRVWDLLLGHCLQTIQGHSSVVMGLLSWESFLLSCSLDGTMKVWAISQNGLLEEVYTHPDDASPNEALEGALTLCGFIDEQGKSIVVCSYNDNSVHLYELPTFVERCVLFSPKEVRALQVGPGGLLFSGHSSGEVRVWKWT